MKKNDVVELEIIDIGSGGEGIGKVDGFTVFVKDAIVGDIVEVKMMKTKKSYGYGKIVKVLTKSKYRVDPVCHVTTKCGGCQVQEMDYKKQLEFKANKVKNNLQRIGGFEEVMLNNIMQPIVGMDEPVKYRNKAQFPLSMDKEGNVITGFYAQGTHAIISNTNCAIGVDINESILQVVLSFMKEYKIKAYEEVSGTGLVRHVLIRYGFTTKEIMVCLVINGNTLPKAEKLVEKLNKLNGMTSICISINKKKTNVIMGDSFEVLDGKGYITDYIGDVQYQISPLSFFQVNPIQTELLYGKTLQYAGLTGKETVWDLYCGIGSISLFLAQKASKVYGVEIIPQAIQNAEVNAKLNSMDNVEFFVGKAEEVLPREYAENKIYADVIVVDPPRKGCDESLLNTMIDMAPKRIVYVSCDSATLARDLKILVAEGYKLEEVTPVDMFPHTTHVESVALLVKDC